MKIEVKKKPIEGGDFDITMKIKGTSLELQHIDLNKLK